LDGTVYRGNQVISGVPEAIEQLRKRGIKIFFLSNASMKTRMQQAEKLQNMGIACTIKEMYNSAYATASYIAYHHPKATVHVVSEGGLQNELEAFCRRSAQSRTGLKVVTSENADIVAIGMDTKITFEKLITPLRAIINGAVFIASNVDRIYPTEKGILPGSGTIAAFLEYGSGKKPIVIGKPESPIIEAVLKDNNLKRSEVLIVGDGLETDLKVAKRMKMKCALVLTGLAKMSDVKKLKKNDKPDFVLESVVELPKVL
ncbi:MAG: HAD-IIA family hydrolase, partial [Candidatus Micrarchaeota archaeon]|nr:HAD-IIA family hydrolase [Candidatus Micrarchaeota archaeon]